MQTDADRAGDLTPQQWQAIGEWLRTGSADAAARVAGVSDRTLRRWRNQPAFRAALRQVGRGLAHAAASRVLAVTAMTADRAPWPVRVAAGGRLLDHGQTIAADDLTTRLDDLEQRMDS